MKNIFYSLLFAILIVNALVTYGDEVDGISAVVGKEIILQSEVEDMVQSYMMNRRSNLSEEDAEKLRNEILQQLINNKVLFYQAEKDSVIVTRQEIEKSVEMRLKELNQMFGSQSKLKEALAQEGMTLRDLKKQYLDQERAQLISQKMQMQKTMNVTISAKEVKDFFEEYKDSIPQQQESFKMSFIYLEADDRFPEICKKYSIHAQTAKKGGFLGWVKKTEVLPEFKEILDTLSLFTLSQPVKTQLGVHLLQYTDTLDEKYRLRHILLNDKSGGDVLDQATIIKRELDLNASRMKEQYEKLDSLKHEIVENGVDFMEMAKTFSEDPVSKEKGGNVGWRSVNDFKILFPHHYQDIQSLKVGDYSSILRTEEGFYLLHILDHSEQRDLNLENDWSTIENYALMHKKNQVFNKWMKKISKDYYIKKF